MSSLPFLIVWSVAVCFSASESLASEVSKELVSMNSNPIGVGGIVAQSGSQGMIQSGVLLEASNHFRQRIGHLGVRQYGFAQSRGEWTGQFSIALHASTGVTLIGLRERQTASIFLGAEPLSGRVAWRPAIMDSSFFQWNPLLSTGGQLAFQSCRTLGAVRLGASVGNIHSSGLAPILGNSRGLLFALNCDRMDLSAEVLRQKDDQGSATFRVLDLTWNVPESRWKMGTRWEWTGIAPDRREDERRWMFVMRSNPWEE